VLCTAAKGIAEIITLAGRINMDFADVRTAMKDSGVALIGVGRCSGENRAEEAVNQAINSPLLNNNSIRGAKNVLLNIVMGEKELKVSEVKKVNEIVLNEVGDASKLYIKTGIGNNPQLGEDVTVSIIATGFEMGDVGIADVPPAGAPPAYAQPPIITVNGGRKGGAVPIGVDNSWDDPMDDPLNPFAAIAEKKEELENERGYAGNARSKRGVTSEPGTVTIPTPSGKRIPRLLDVSLSDDELDRPIRSAKSRRTNRSNDEVTNLTFVGGSWEQSSASYVNGKPD
jgi:hypothetical protein